MTSTYTQKSAALQRMASHNAASVIDSSAQGASLQRKADMMGGAIQCASLEEEEEPVQGKFIQREAIPEEEKLTPHCHSRLRAGTSFSYKRTFP